LSRDGGAGPDVGSDVVRGFEVTCVGRFSASQVEGDDSPEASDFAWIFVVKPPPKRPSAWPSCPFCSGRRHMRPHDGRIEHLNEMGGGAHRRERIEEGLEDAGLCSNGRSASLCCPGTETLRQSAQRTFSTVKK